MTRWIVVMTNVQISQYMNAYLYYLIVSEGQQYLHITRMFVVLSKQWCVKDLASQSIYFSKVSLSFILQK